MGGKVSMISIARPLLERLTYPMLPNTWRFRDSNLDADFPTAAREGELEYTREGGNVPVQGVIAFNHC